MEYVLGPDDEISIRVNDIEEMSDRVTRVDPAGNVDLPLAGRLHAGGLSVDQLRQVLSDKFSKYVTNPQITINIRDYKSEPVSILGEVNTPGVHQLKGPQRLVDIISAAGGLKPDAGNTVTITRQLRWGMVPVPNVRQDLSQQFCVASIQLDSVTRGINPEENIAIFPNDIISVAKAPVVYVVGEVKKAGGFSLETKSEISIIRALSLAEGLAPGAAPRKARILRSQGGDGKDAPETAVDVQMILAGKAPDLRLRPDDILFIPNNLAGSALKRATEAAVQIATGVIIFR
jgi:polysaccharide biosynthesis/export protein